MNSGKNTLNEARSNIHVIIPTLNEANFIEKILSQLSSFETVTVVDGGSIDDTLSIVEHKGVELINSDIRGRAIQMNLGAKKSKSAYLLFLHADIELPQDFARQLERFIIKNEPQAANFSLSFDSENWFLKVNALFSYLNCLPFQFGDQGLLIQRELFEKLGGFNECLLYMEGNDLIARIKKVNSFQKIPMNIKVSTRKYQEKGIYRLQLAYFIIYALTRIGVPQQKVKSWFRSFF